MSALALQMIRTLFSSESERLYSSLDFNGMDDSLEHEACRFLWRFQLVI